MHLACTSENDHRKERYYVTDQGNKTNFKKERKRRVISVTIAFDLYICWLGIFVI